MARGAREPPRASRSVNPAGLAEAQARKLCLSLLTGCQRHPAERKRDETVLTEVAARVIEAGFDVAAEVAPNHTMLIGSRRDAILDLK